ncbi:condensation domain-containing protein [Nocardia sp. Marseille-Q1738]
MNNSAAGILSEPIGHGFWPVVARGARPAVRLVPPPRRPVLLARGPRPAYVPLAPAQERMWHAARAGNSSDWNVARAVRLSGPALRPEALVAAIGDVVARHEPLRTRYPETASGPAQVVVPAAEALVRPELIAVTEDELRQHIAEFAAREFDLAAGLPLRARLCVLGPHDIVLVLVVHHISIDGRSVAPLLRDLVTAYLARQAGAAPAWTPLPVDYIDYTLWKHAQLGDYSDEWSRATQQLRYWANTLAGRPAVLEFPCDRPRPARRAGMAGAGATVPVAFGPDVHRALLERACEARASLFMVLQAAFAVAVGAFSGSDDVTVATAVAGRDHRLLDDLVGNFADDVLLRVRLDRAADVDELLDQVRRVALAAFAHPDTPNQRLKRCLLQDASCALFQATLILQRGAAAQPADTGGELTVSEIDTGVIRAEHDLEFGLVDRYDRVGTPAGIDGVFIYPTALFERGTAAAFVELFMATVELFATGYRGPLAPLLGHARRPIAVR